MIKSTALAVRSILREFRQGEYTLTLRLASQLADLRVGYANPIPRLAARCGAIWSRDKQTKEKHRKCGAFLLFGDPYGNRTHAFAVRGRRLSRLTNGPYFGQQQYYTTLFFKMQALFAKKLKFFKNIFGVLFGALQATNRHQKSKRANTQDENLVCLLFFLLVIMLRII